jgi:hypothetical protein
MKKLLEYLGPYRKFFIYGDQIKPMRDWFLVLGISCVVLLLSVAWNIFLFHQLESAKSAAVQQEAATQPGLGDAVVQIQSIFQDRATEEGNYGKLYHFVDPSQPGA